VKRTGHGGQFDVGVGALRKHPGTRRAVTVSDSIAEASNSGSRVAEGSDVEFDGAVESILGGVVVTGTVSATWEGACRRCLETATGRLVTEVREICSDDPELDVEYTVTADWLDLEPVVHDACILELPLAPLCKDDCLGLCPRCGANRNRETCSCTDEIDPRWGALAGLEGTDPE
jgi:uncharacterized protein